MTKRRPTNLQVLGVLSTYATDLVVGSLRHGGSAAAAENDHPDDDSDTEAQEDEPPSDPELATALDEALAEPTPTFVDPFPRAGPKLVFRDLVDALRQLHQVLVAPSTTALAAIRNDEGEWFLRLTRQRKLHHGRTIVLSSTLRPEQLRLAFGSHLRARVHEP